MFDTNLCVVGNVLTKPEWRRVANTGALVAHFRIASTARRFDRASSDWVDGNHLRIRVTAWRRLAEGVASSVAVGDPLVISGRIYTREWKDEEGKNRLAYELEARSIGHDLARGRARFFRTKAAQLADAAEDGGSDEYVNGELSVALPADEEPVTYGEVGPDQLPGEEMPVFEEAPVFAEEPDEELALEVERLAEEQPPATRRSRRKREPVAA